VLPTATILWRSDRGAMRGLNGCTRIDVSQFDGGKAVDDELAGMRCG
jgi:hypothetical protein